jgi:putative PEP-CTERM system integral membrane protein
MKRCFDLLRRRGPVFLFGSWNLIFLSLAFFGVGPHVVRDLVQELWDDGLVPIEYAAAALLLLLIPTLATALALGLRLARPRRRLDLLGLFYGVEAPLLFLVVLRVFVLRALTGAVAAILVLLLIALSAHFFELLREGRPASWPSVDLAARTAGLLGVVYLAALLAFFVPPLGTAFFAEFLRFRWLTSISLAGGVTAVLFLFFFGYSTTLFFGLPLALLLLFGAAFRRAYRAYRDFGAGATRARALTLGVALALIGLLAGLSRQGQARALMLLEKPPQSDAERRALLAEERAIRDGLLNAYLAPYRYLATEAESRTVAELYRSNLRTPEPLNLALQRAFNALAAPLLYQGPTLGGDVARAASAYAAFFGQPIQRAEKDAILAALASTWERADRSASLLEAGQRKAWLTAQDVAVDEHGDLAEIEVHEVYRGMTGQQEEVWISFSLPPSAAITGLWLGEGPERDRRQRFVVAPRGAAQAVYRGEVRRRRDPALLEQVGPQQYRLRVFPIPAQRSKAEVHLWFSYTVLEDDGAWPAPVLLEARNRFPTDQTACTLRGRTAPGPILVEGAASRIAAAGRPEAVAHRFDLPDGRAVLATPGEAPAFDWSGRRIAIVLDRSRSMAAQAERAADAIAWLLDALGPDGDADLYATSSPARGEPPSRIAHLSSFDAKDVAGFGGPADLLGQFAVLSGAERYDAVVVLTDVGCYELAKDGAPVGDLGAPVWFVHLGGRLPAAYPDATLAAIQRSGGGIATRVQQIRPDGAALGYRFLEVDLPVIGGASPPAGWTGARTRPNSADATPNNDPRFGPLAASFLARGAARHVERDPAALERIHRLAERFEIVTPYSSMIVLVDDVQRSALARLEAAEGRFDRKLETGEATLAPPPASGVLASIHAAPEPEASALLGIAAVGLLFLIRSRGSRGHALTPLV